YDLLDVAGAARSRPSIAIARGEVVSANDEQELTRLFDDEPLEAGVEHPAVALVAKLVAIHGSQFGSWVEGLLLREGGDEALSVGVLRCLGRLHRGLVASWGHQVAAAALVHGSLAVRDAAVRALEAWGGRDAKEILASHVEPV